MKVCIVGTAPGSRLIAPYKDESFEIWGCSAGNSQSSALPRITKWFELHAVYDMMAAENVAWCAPYFGWLRAQSFPVYMQEQNEFIPNAIVFPYKALTEEFGPNPKKGLSNWFTSSVAWMMAFAITQMKEGDELAIFGVDMAATEEHYSSQKAGCLRFVEIARSRGIKVTIPYESCLGKTFPLYGYAEATPMGRKLAVRQLEIRSHKANLDGQIRSLELQRAFFEGALEAVQYDQRTWVDGMDAEIDDGDVEKGKAVAMLEALKATSGYVEHQHVLTSAFSENGQGVFVPASMAANGPSLPEPQPEATFTVDEHGKRHYAMNIETGIFSSHQTDPAAHPKPEINSEPDANPQPASRRKRSAANGVADNPG